VLASDAFFPFSNVVTAHLSRIDLSAPICSQGSVLASDAFFPFSWNDSVEIACQVGGVGVNWLLFLPEAAVALSRVCCMCNPVALHWCMFARGVKSLATAARMFMPASSCTCTPAGGRERHRAPRRQPARPGRHRLLQQVSLLCVELCSRPSVLLLAQAMMGVWVHLLFVRLAPELPSTLLC